MTVLTTDHCLFCGLKRPKANSGYQAIFDAFCHMFGSCLIEQHYLLLDVPDLIPDEILACDNMSVCVQYTSKPQSVTVKSSELG